MTTPISITKPVPGGDNGDWGDVLNTALDTIVTGVNSAGTAVNALPPVGTTSGTVAAGDDSRFTVLSSSGTTVQSAITGLSLNPNSATNAMASRVLATVNPFLQWCQKNGVKGAITEMASGRSSVNPTDVIRWTEVTERYLSVLDDYDWPVLTWTDEGWYNAFPGLRAGTPAIDDRGQVLVRHSRSGPRGLTVGGAVGTTPPGSYNNTNPNTSTNWFPSTACYPALYAQGVRVVRIPFRWETIQQSLLGALDSGTVSAIQAQVTAAGNAGIKVILDLHNYGLYISGTGTLHLGDGSLTTAHLVDLWTKLSTTFKGNANIYGYEVMNEPGTMGAGSYTATVSGTGTLKPGVTITVGSTAAFPSGHSFGCTLATSGGTALLSATVTSGITLLVNDVANGKNNTWANGAAFASPNLFWEVTAQAVVTAIRGNSDSQQILVPGYWFQKAEYWPVSHPAGFITDTGSNFRYAAHNYWSSNGSGDSLYQAWATELAALVYGGGGGNVPLGGRGIGSTAESLPLQSGETTLPRQTVGDTNVLATGVAKFTTFIAQKTEAITKVTFYSRSQAAAATPTLVKYAVYRVNSDQSFTLEAVTSNATSTFSSTFTKYQLTLNSTFQKVAGQLYAVGVLVVSGTTMPKLAGNNNVYDPDLWPWTCFQMFGLSDFPAYIDRGATSTGQDVIYASLLP